MGLAAGTSWCCMAEYAKVEMRLKMATASTAAPKQDTGLITEALTSDRVKHSELDVPTASALTVYDHDVEAWSAIDALFIDVTGSNNVTVTYTDVGSNARTHIVGDGKQLLLTELGLGDITLQAATALTEVHFMLLGTA